jgi:hypothetical protein
MSYSKQSDSELADSVQVLINNRSAHKVTCLDDALADSLAAELEGLNTDFKQDIDDSAEFTAKKQAANESKKARQDRIVKVTANVGRYIYAADGPESDYALCGLGIRDAWSYVSANTPDDLVAVGSRTSGNKLTYRGNNKRGSVTYEIWRAEGRDAEWSFIGTTKRQSYVDQTAESGKDYWYRVRALAAKSISGYSNNAVVYCPA